MHTFYVFQVLNVVAGSVVVLAEVAYYTIPQAQDFLATVKCCVRAAFDSISFFGWNVTDNTDWLGTPELQSVAIEYHIEVPPPPTAGESTDSPFKQSWFWGLVAGTFIIGALTASAVFMWRYRKKLLQQVDVEGESWIPKAVSKEVALAISDETPSMSSPNARGQIVPVSSPSTPPARIGMPSTASATNSGYSAVASPFATPAQVYTRFEDDPGQ